MEQTVDPGGTTTVVLLGGGGDGLLLLMQPATPRLKASQRNFRWRPLTCSMPMRRMMHFLADGKTAVELVHFFDNAAILQLAHR